MTDKEVAALHRGDMLMDRRGREWRVLHEPKYEHVSNSHWAMIRSGDYAMRLHYRNAEDFRPKES